MSFYIGVWLMLAIHILSLGINIALHGQDKNQSYNGWTELLGLGLFVALLWWVGLL